MLHAAKRGQAPGSDKLPAVVRQIVFLHIKLAFTRVAKATEGDLSPS
jgi:hypothetical protein